MDIDGYFRVKNNTGGFVYQFHRVERAGQDTTYTVNFILIGKSYLQCY